MWLNRPVYFIFLSISWSSDVLHHLLQVLNWEKKLSSMFPLWVSRFLKMTRRYVKWDTCFVSVNHVWHTDFSLCFCATSMLLLSMLRLSCLFILACCRSSNKAARAVSTRVRSCCSSACFFSSSNLCRGVQKQTVSLPPELLLKNLKIAHFICSCFTFFSSIWCLWIWMICCRLSGGELLSLLRPGTPTTLGGGSSSFPSCCPSRSFFVTCSGERNCCCNSAALEFIHSFWGLLNCRYMKCTETAFSDMVYTVQP